MPPKKRVPIERPPKGNPDRRSVVSKEPLDPDSSRTRRRPRSAGRGRAADDASGLVTARNSPTHKRQSRNAGRPADGVAAVVLPTVARLDAAASDSGAQAHAGAADVGDGSGLSVPADAAATVPSARDIVALARRSRASAAHLYFDTGYSLWAAAAKASIPTHKPSLPGSKRLMAPGPGPSLSSMQLEAEGRALPPAQQFTRREHDVAGRVHGALGMARSKTDKMFASTSAVELPADVTDSEVLYAFGLLQENHRISFSQDGERFQMETRLQIDPNQPRSIRLHRQTYEQRLRQRTRQRAGGELRWLI